MLTRQPPSSVTHALLRAPSAAAGGDRGGAGVGETSPKQAPPTPDLELSRLLSHSEEECIEVYGSQNGQIDVS